jgi:predicted ATPase/DNA-binding SARP family transcriptional activator
MHEMRESTQVDEAGGTARAATPAAYVRVLGPIQIVDRDGVFRDLPSASQRRLVALLAINGRRTLRAEHLADVLGISPGALRTTVSRLRRVLDEELLRTDPVGYRLDLDVDAALFASMLDEAAESPDPRALLDQALALWRGGAIDEFAHEHWAASESARLEELHAVAVERLAQTLIAHRRFGEALATVEPLAAAHPLRDRAHGLMMEALAGAGRQTEALRVFQHYRTFLIDTSGIEPSPEVRALERRIATGVESPPQTGFNGPDSLRDLVDEADDSSVTSPQSLITLSEFVGRTGEVASVVDHVRQPGLVTLTGVGGVGKTRLATYVIDLIREREQVWFVDLAAVSEPSGVADAVALAMKVPKLGGVHGLSTQLADRRAVLVLDNCEHVLAASADMVEAIVSGCPLITVLATSRQQLATRGERVVPVLPLDPQGPGAELFRTRAEAGGAQLRRGDDETIVTICRRLDGNPLAIELAASRVPALGLSTILEGLDDRFAVIDSAVTANVDRKRSVRATVDWSYQLLSGDERRAFRALGVFAGGFEVDAARHVISALGGVSRKVVGYLASLVDRNMLVVDSQQPVSRFRLLETLRAFAVDELERHHEFDAAASAHAEWVATITDVDALDWFTAETHRRTLRLERDVENWREAMDYARTTGRSELGRRLCGAPSALLVWGRPDLGGVIEAHDSVLAADDDRRINVALAAWGPAWARLDLTAMSAVEDRLQNLEPDDHSGANAVVASARLLVMGDVPAAISRRIAAIAGPGTPKGAKEYCLVLGLYLVTSSGRLDLEPPGWIPLITEVAADGDVPVNRLIAQTALAWRLAGGDQAASDLWMKQAVSHDDPLPAFHRTLVGSFVSRMLITRAPHIAAAQLLAVLTGAVREPALTDSIALVTSAGLLATVSHPDADDIVATLAHHSVTVYLGTLVTDMTQRQERGRLLRYSDLHATVCAALSDLVASVASSPVGQ